MRHSIKMLDLSKRPISIENMDRLIQSLPTRVGEHDDPAWQEESYCAEVVKSIRARKEELTEAEWDDLDYAISFLLKKWPALAPETSSSIEATWSSLADRFRFEPFKRVFSSGVCTIVPEQTVYERKIFVIATPYLEYGHTGRIINCLMKLVHQRAWLQMAGQHERVSFLWQDEFQVFVTRHDNRFQQVCRSVRVANVCISQNILNLSEELGEDYLGSRTKSFLGNLMVRIMHQQNDVDTNAYAADLIGKEYRQLKGMSVGNSPSISTSEHLEYRVLPEEFSALAKPNTQEPTAEALIYVGGRTFNATITDKRPQGRNYLRVRFTR